MTRDEARGWFVLFLLDKVRSDRYPSRQHLDLIEESLPREMVGDYIEVLMEKATQDRFPSLDMLSRMQRMAESCGA